MSLELVEEVGGVRVCWWVRGGELGQGGVEGGVRVVVMVRVGRGVEVVNEGSRRDGWR